MLDIKKIVENPQKYKDGLSKRNGTYDIDVLVALYEERRTYLQRVEGLKAERNRVSQLISQQKRNKEDASDLVAKMQVVGNEIKELDAQLSQIESSLKALLLSTANLPDESVPIGKDETANVEIRKFGSIPEFGFSPKPHWEIGESLGILDFASAAKITGTRFTVYRGLGAKLERAIINFMLDTHSCSGYTEILPPFMVNRDSMTGTGQLPKFEEDAFSVKNTDYFLVPTAEVPVTNLFRDTVAPENSLPISYCAYTACFRAEAGSAGRDTRGLIRQHQFNKVELVKITTAEQSMSELEKLTADAEKILQLLGLPYHVVALCSGDTGFSSAKTYDIEVYMPSYGKYVEISSCSCFKDFQARRMNIKYKENGTSYLAHTLNGSGLAVGRTVAAILENYQNEDGTVRVPNALVPYLKTDIIK
jgi:seryl-tRNA synthetase